MERFICVHGHFYQPPRENAWLESIELQDSAYPYHDWNERITAECYEPNTASHILDDGGMVREIFNNYAKISFNFGPTLLAWMQGICPEVYKAIIEADRESLGSFSGHGSAQAQAYSHMIMPLANTRDKYTQVSWGIRDFENRFGRKPEGMWLPETAVDTQTLDIMAEMGIRFTILAPHQARRIRRIGATGWQDLEGDEIDTKMPYEVVLPSGRKMALFFYDGPTARSVAFEGLLARGEDFARRLVGMFSEGQSLPQLVHIATDGETYGHHHRFGDMALAYALNYIESHKLAKITNYSEYLDRFPPAFEVEIREDTSWSCAHGLERWRSNCGCNTGRGVNWDQEWRGPLREALDWLRDAVAPMYEAKTGTILRDPWAARDNYIEVILDRSPENVDRFFNRHAMRSLDEAERIVTLKLLELQRHAMLMYTSCGWFFDELSGIETVQVIQYAGRVVQLGEELLGQPLEKSFVNILERARSNIREIGSGRDVYERMVKPAMVDLEKVGAHFAVSSMFEDYNDEADIYCYQVSVQDFRRLQAGRAKLAMGRATIASLITTENVELCFGALHFGDHNMNAGVRTNQGEKAFQGMKEDLKRAFAITDLPEVIRQLDRHFGKSTYSLRSLFRDEQRKVVDFILESALGDAEGALRQIYEYHYPLMSFLTELGAPVPKAYHAAAGFILDTDLKRHVSRIPLDVDRIRTLLTEAKRWRVEVDAAGLTYMLKKTLEDMISRLSLEPEDISILENLTSAAELAGEMPHPVDLWKVQNIFYEMIYINYPGFQRRSQKGDEMAFQWKSLFLTLGDRLRVRVT